MRQSKKSHSVKRQRMRYAGSTMPLDVSMERQRNILISFR